MFESFEFAPPGVQTKPSEGPSPDWILTLPMTIECWIRSGRDGEMEGRFPPGDFDLAHWGLEPVARTVWK